MSRKSCERLQHPVYSIPHDRHTHVDFPFQQPPSPGKGAFECEQGALAGVTPTLGPSALSISTVPTSWEPDGVLTFDSIVGNAVAKRALFEHVVLPLKLSEEARSSIFGEKYMGWLFHAGRREREFPRLYS